jgi:hypothetical protein
MLLRHFLFTARLAALALWLRIRTLLGLPRCDCPDHCTPPRPWPPNAPPCPCTSARGAGVSRLCPHATFMYARIRKRTIAGTDFWSIDADPTLRAAATQAELDREQDKDAGWNDAPTDD